MQQNCRYVLNQTFYKGDTRIYFAPNNIKIVEGHSTVTDLAKFLGQSTLHPLCVVSVINIRIVVNITVWSMMNMMMVVMIIIIVIMMQITMMVMMMTMMMMT